MKIVYCTGMLGGNEFCIYIKYKFPGRPRNLNTNIIFCVRNSTKNKNTILFSEKCELNNSPNIIINNSFFQRMELTFESHDSFKNFESA